MLPFCISLLLQSPHHPLLHLWKCFDKAQAQTVNFDFSFCNMINDFINFDDAGEVLVMLSTVPLTPRTCRIPLSCRMSSYSETWSHKWKMRAALSKLKTTDLQQLNSWHPWYFLNPSFTLFMRHSKRDCFAIQMGNNLLWTYQICELQHLHSKDTSGMMRTRMEFLHCAGAFSPTHISCQLKLQLGNSCKNEYLSRT